ncbi:MAG TPA: phasin family protein [Alphaproteobacteria bacterium]|nr:phasin family protein [Alphaproteobacteria bacterium]
MAKETNIPPFGNAEANPFKQFDAFKQFKFPGLDLETLLLNYQKNMELMNSTQQVAVEATKSIMKLQNDYFKKVFDQWNEQVKCCCSKTPLEDKTTRQAEVTKAALDQAVEHTQGLTSIVAKSNEKIVDSVQKRIKEGLDESLNLAKKSREKHR